MDNKRIIDDMGHSIAIGESSLLEGWDLLHGMDLPAYDTFNICYYFKSMGDIPSLMPDYSSVRFLEKSRHVPRFGYYSWEWGFKYKMGDMCIVIERKNNERFNRA
jgi:hypothetical protein